MIFTIGHGNREASELISLLQDADIELLADVRRYPGSRRHPHFSRENLEAILQKEGIVYYRLGQSLGGLRKPVAASPHSALKNSSFRAYADHMGSDEYQAGLEELIRQSKERRVAIMCAERLPWQCHRSLIADSLVARGISVTHLIGPKQTMAHALNPAARVRDGLPVYDVGAQADLL